MTPGNFSKFLPLLAENQVDYILIGGGAAIAHGAARTTYDIDIVYSRTPTNLTKIVEALQDLNPYYRGAPAGLPFKWDEQTIQNGLNFTLTTDWGDIDLLGEVSGDGTYDKLLDFTDTIQLYEHPVRVVSLEKLIHLKRAAGRPKDFEAIAELEILLKLRDE